MLSDLRESGSLEQDADCVIFAYRPSYYGIDQDAAGNSTEGILELIIEKNRHGSTCPIPIKHNTTLTKFFDYDKYGYEQESPKEGLAPNSSFYDKDKEDPF